MSVQRYEPTEWGQMDADAEGGWVTYADYVAEIQRLTDYYIGDLRGLLRSDSLLYSYIEKEKP